MPESPPNIHINFWFEFASTYSYPAALRIEALAAMSGVAVSWRPFLLGPILGSQGLTDSPFNVFPAKGRYMWRDLERICKAQGLGFQRPSQFPRNGLLAARVACRFAQSPWLPEFVRSVYRANFIGDLDISSPQTVAACLACSKEDPASLIKQAQSPDSKMRLREQTEEAAALGIFGAPACTIGGELFWGNDRLDSAIAWAVSHAVPSA